MTEHQNDDPQEACRRCGGSGCAFCAGAGEVPYGTLGNEGPEEEVAGSDEIQRCGRATNHAQVPGTHFCLCAHAMYDDDEAHTYESLEASGAVSEFLPPTQEQTVAYLEDEVTRLRSMSAHLAEENERHRKLQRLLLAAVREAAAGRLSEAHHILEEAEEAIHA